MTIGGRVLAGQSSADDALAVIRYHLDRLLPATWPKTPAQDAQ